MTSADLSADRRPIIGRLPKPQNCWPMEKKYNKVVVIYFCRPMKKELKIGILSADKSADCRPTVGGVNVIAVLPAILQAITTDDSGRVNYKTSNQAGSR